jgi:hypothetical protein
MGSKGGKGVNSTQDFNDAIAEFRRVLGDPLAFRLLALGCQLARGWVGPNTSNLLERIVATGSAVREAGLEPAVRAAAAKWSARSRKAARPFDALVEIVGDMPRLLDALDGQIRDLQELRRAIAQPAPRPTAGAVSA